MQNLEDLLGSMQTWSRISDLPSEKQSLFLNILRETMEKNGSRLSMCNEFVQHGDTSVLKHVIMVAVMACLIVCRLNIKVKEEELIRGALLHDYFLYDWHEPSLAHSIHGYTHPRIAMNHALEDFNLTDREKNMILRHMFPLTPVPPRYREGMILCLADKICAAEETIHGRRHR